MYTLFNQPPSASGPRYSFPKLRMIRDGLNSNFARWVDYQRYSGFAVKSEHLLVKLIQNTPIPFGSNVQKYRDAISDISNQLGNALHLTTGTQAGKTVTPGIFYGKNIEEVLLVIDDSKGIDLVKSDWREWEPVRVWSHPIGDLTFNAFNGQPLTDDRGYAVITIDIPLLLTQYRQWYLQERNSTAGETNSIMQFVYSYPLANLLHSHINWAWFNQLVAAFHDDPVLPAIRRPVINMPDYSRHLQGVIAECNDLLKLKALTYDQLLETVPVWTAEKLADIVALPKTPDIRQVRWALIAARLRLISYLVQLDRYHTNSRNTQDNSTIRKSIQRIAADKTFNVGISLHAQQTFLSTILQQIQPYI